jgi:hypothetical protein
MAFVYDPFSMDGPGESLLMDWGTPDTNETVHAYIIKKRPRDRILHTFTFPVKRVSFHPRSDSDHLMIMYDRESGIILAPTNGT